MNRFVVMTYSPKLSGKARQYSGTYCGIRVVETTDGQRPVSVNAKTVVRVVEEWGAMPMGKTSKSRGRQALDEAKALATKLNTANVITQTEEVT